jgi:hypothetical protein
LAVGLMSVNPRRKPDDGGAMVGRTLLGCISDMGGFMGDEPPGVLGTRTGDEATGGLVASLAASLAAFLATLRAGLGATSAGLSSCSTTEDRVGFSVACLGACN